MAVSQFQTVKPSLAVLKAVDQQLASDDLRLHIPEHILNESRLEIISALVATCFLEDSDTQTVLSTLGQIGPEAVPALKYLLGSLKLDEMEQKELVLAMGQWADSLPTLFEIAASEAFSFEVRLKANNCAGELLFQEKEFQEVQRVLNGNDGCK